MIPFASQRGNGRDLATHLLNTYDNDMVEVASVRGAIAKDLHGAFKEWQVQAEVLTKCRNYLYSLSINPDPEQGSLTREQYVDYITRAEDALGLTGQPRAIVFHTKNGREHCHVAWSRIDTARQRAVQLAFDNKTLMQVTRDFARDHKLRLPPGYDAPTGEKQRTLYEQAQEQKTGLTQDDHKRTITSAWRSSDNAKAFVQALAEHGYVLATGKRSYVVVDLYGSANALPKLIDDKEVRTADVRAFLGKDYPVESLPTVEEAQKTMAAVLARKKEVETNAEPVRQHEERIAQLKDAQHLRRQGAEEKLRSLREDLETRYAALRHSHRMDRDSLRGGYLADVRARRLDRARNGPKGLAAFLGRISGVTFLLERRQRAQDAARLKVHKKAVAKLQKDQRQECQALDRRSRVLERAGSRQLRNLESLDRRELSALVRDENRDRLTAAREPDGKLPSVEQLTIASASPARTVVPDVLSAFENARRGQQGSRLPDIAGDFAKASGQAKADGNGGGGGGPGPPPDSPLNPRRGRQRQRDRE